MTVEESKRLWEIEKQNLDKNTLPISPKVTKLYNIVGHLIESGELLYQTFVDDIVDAMTEIATNTVEEDPKQDNKHNIELMCDKLIEKYTTTVKEENND